MDSAAGARWSGGDDSFVDVVAVHPLATEFGKEGRVDVEDLPWVSGEDFGREEGHVAGEGDESDFCVLEGAQEFLGVGGRFGVEVEGGDFGFLGDFEGRGVWLWGDDEGGLGEVRVCGGGLKEGGHIGATSTRPDEDSEAWRV